MPIVRIALALALFVGALSTSANAKSAADSSPNAYIHSLVQLSSCTKLKVFSDHKGHNNVAIGVPIKINGKRYWFQLDTGTPDTKLYGKKIVQNIDDQAVKPRWARVENVELAGHTLGPRVFERIKDREPGDTNGTLGLDLLMGYATVLDFPDRRFCLFNPSVVSARLNRFRSGMRRAEGRLYHNHVTFNLHVDNQQFKNVMYDSGSSVIALQINKSKWQHITGQSGPKDATNIIHGLSWGKPIALVSAPVKGTLRLGNMRFKNPLATYVTGKNIDFGANNDFGGLLGNALFMHSTIILRMSPAPRLYVIPHSKKSERDGDS